MNISWTIFFAFALLGAAACVISGTYLGERWSKTSGRAMMLIGVLLAAIALIGGLANSSIINILDAVFIMMAFGIFACLATSAGLIIALAKRSLSAVMVSSLIVLVAGTLIGVNAAGIPKENRAREIASDCEKAGIDKEICSRFSDNYDSPNIAKLVFRTSGSREEARIMLTGGFTQSDDCVSKINGKEPPIKTLSEVLTNPLRPSKIAPIKNIDDWCSAVEGATFGTSSVNVTRVEQDGQLRECRAEDRSSISICWDIKGEK